MSQTKNTTDEMDSLLTAERAAKAARDETEEAWKAASRRQSAADEAADSIVGRFLTSLGFMDRLRERDVADREYRDANARVSAASYVFEDARAARAKAEDAASNAASEAAVWRLSNAETRWRENEADHVAFAEYKALREEYGISVPISSGCSC